VYTVILIYVHMCWLLMYHAGESLHSPDWIEVANVVAMQSDNAG